MLYVYVCAIQFIYVTSMYKLDVPLQVDHTGCVMYEIPFLAQSTGEHKSCKTHGE